MGLRFRAKVIPSGNATAVEIPASVMKALVGLMPARRLR
jgi:antitoxin component of MazEF toxin-antitoxin module